MLLLLSNESLTGPNLFFIRDALNRLLRILFCSTLLAMPALLKGQQLYLGASAGISMGFNKFIPGFPFSPNNEQWIVPTLSYGLHLGLESKSQSRSMELFHGNYNTGMGARIRVVRNESVGSSSTYTGYLNSLSGLRFHSRIYQKQRYSFWLGVGGTIEKISFSNISKGPESIGGGVLSKRSLTRDTLVFHYKWVPGIEVILGNRFQLSKNWSLTIQAIGHLGFRYYATSFYTSTIDQNQYQFAIQKKGDLLALLIKLDYRLFSFNNKSSKSNAGAHPKK